MNTDLSIQEEIDIYINSGLTPSELFLVKLIFLSIEGDKSYLINYLTNVKDGKILLRNVLQSLIDKKVISLTYKIPKEGEIFDPSNIPFNKNFLKKYIRHSNEIGKEFFDNYPSFININGKLCSIKNFTKANLFSLDDFCKYYTKSIKYSNVTHEYVMEMLNFGKENNLINYSIIEFIASQKYKELEFIKNSDNINGYNNSELV
jgi:hypothetical protein